MPGLRDTVSLVAALPVSLVLGWIIMRDNTNEVTFFNPPGTGLRTGQQVDSSFISCEQ